MLHDDFRPSKLAQFEACPASFFMQVGIKQEESEYAGEGTMLHDKVAKHNTENLTVEQATCVERCMELLEKLKQPNGEWLHEQVLSIVGDDFNGLIGGTADAVNIDEKAMKGILIDWKFGRLPVTPVKDNYQMKTYASAMFQNYDVETVDCYVFQPRIKDGLGKHTFTRADLKDYPVKVLEIWGKCNDGLQFHASEEACQYCKAKCDCPEFARKSESVKGELVKIEHTHDLTIEQMPKALEQAQIAKSIVKQFEEKISGIEHRAKELLIENQQIPGWSIKTRQGARICTQPNQLWTTLSNVVHDGKPIFEVAEFMGCVDISIKELEELFCKKAKSVKLTKTEKDAKVLLEKIIVPFIGRKPDSLILKKITEEGE